MQARVVSAAEFCARVLPALAAREAENNLPFGIALRLASGAAKVADALLLSVESEGQVVAGAVRTPPHDIVVTRLPAGAPQLVAAHFLAQAPPVTGASGPEDSGRDVAECLAQRIGSRARVRMRQWVYELSALSPVPKPSGQARLAERAEQPLVARWFREFVEEARLVHAGDADAWARLVIESEAAYFWDDDGPTAFACQSRETPNGRCIGPVYTPPPQRRHGYATALVAELARQTLDSGKRFACLFTDNANPTSNHIYETIGFRKVCRFDAYAIDSAGRGNA
jgi:GNAT superfamily N-acetyltransferase